MAFQPSPRKQFRLTRRMKILMFLAVALLLVLIFVAGTSGYEVSPYVILALLSSFILAIIFIDLNGFMRRRLDA